MIQEHKNSTKKNMEFLNISLSNYVDEQSKNYEQN